MSPVSSGAISVVTSNLGQPPSNARSLRILVVDDFEPFRRYTCSTLAKHAGFRIVGEANDGPEAVQKAGDLKPDLVVLDIGLPKLNGIETARRIRFILPECKILFLTGNDYPDIAREAFDAGANGYLVKADTASELQDALEAIMLGRRYVSKKLAGRI